jgi:monoterpene epsilon-lactone hydrolase
MSQEQRDALDQMMRQAPLHLGGDIEEQRVILEQMLTAMPLAHDVVTAPQTLGGIPAVGIDLTGIESDHVILYFHGGAYALGTAAAAAAAPARLADRDRR